MLLMFITSSVKSATLNIIAGLHKPPYVIEKNGDITGFEVELITEVLANMVYQSEFLLVPFARSMKMLKQPNIDAIMTASPKVFTIKSHLTKPYVTYQNVVVSLADRNLAITQISQLGQFSIASFQMASKVLGNEFEVAANKSPYIAEVTSQVRQIEMLSQRKVDTLIMDINIFNYFNRFSKLKVDIARIFPHSSYSLALRDPKLIPEFEKQFKLYVKSKRYLALVDKYNMLSLVN